MDNIKNRIKKVLLVALIFIAHDIAAQDKKPEKLRLFIIGNSFSVNATKYLPQLALEGGYELEIGRAELGGCSLERHWELAAAYEANPNDAKGKAYKGKALKMLLSEGKWDIVTLQQYSRYSPFIDTYYPFVQKLYDYIKAVQPDAKIVIHQTWAYRSDAEKFGLVGKNVEAKSDKEMYEKSRAAYYTVAKQLGIDIIPTGDAFYKVSSNRKWGFKKDTGFNFLNPVYPQLPGDLYSLHVGYKWNNDKKLVFDPNHASIAGEYLGSLVWYNYLFKNSPKKPVFKPEEVSEKFGRYLEQVAFKIF
jgi:hypothetical protein